MQSCGFNHRLAMCYLISFQRKSEKMTALNINDKDCQALFPLHYMICDHRNEYKFGFRSLYFNPFNCK